MTRYPKAGRGNQWTNRELEAIPAAWRGSALSDGDGLSGEVRQTKAGAIRVYFRYAFKWEGKVRWHQCGVWPTVSLAQIRRERDRARQVVNSGVNPALAKQAARIEKKEAMEATIAKAKRDKTQSLTVADLFNEWIRDGVARADGNVALRRHFELDVLPAIGNRPLRKISDKDLLEALRSAKARIAALKRAKGGNRGVTHLAIELKQMLRWAEKRSPWRGLLIEGNPAELIDVNKLLDSDYQEQRDRILTADEIRALHIGLLPLAKMRKLNPRAIILPRIRFAIWICLSTLCRIGELVQAKWEHIDWKAGTWQIPAEHTKGQRGKRQPQLVILSPFALAQFRQLHTETGGGAYCFPSSRREGHTAQSYASGIINEHQKEGGHYPLLSGGRWTMHDMRRTGATMMQGLGIPLEVIDRCQNHVLAGSKVRRHYMHHAYSEEKGEAWRALGAEIERILQAA